MKICVKEQKILGFEDDDLYNIIIIADAIYVSQPMGGSESVTDMGKITSDCENKLFTTFIGNDGNFCSIRTSRIKSTQTISKKDLEYTIEKLSKIYNTVLY